MDKDPSSTGYDAEPDSYPHKEYLFELAKRIILRDAVIDRLERVSGTLSVDMPGQSVSTAGRFIKADDLKDPWRLYDKGVGVVDSLYLPRRGGDNGEIFGEAVMLSIDPSFMSPNVGSSTTFKLHRELTGVEIEYIKRKEGESRPYSKASNANLQELDGILQAIDSEI